MEKHMGRWTPKSPGGHVEARSSTKWAIAPAGDERGQSLVEFALLMPVLFTILLGIVAFGVAFNNYSTLTNATNLGAQALSISRANCRNDTIFSNPPVANSTYASYDYDCSPTPPPSRRTTTILHT